MSEKIRKVEEIESAGFKQVLERFFNEFYLRRVEIEREEIRRKQQPEEAEKKKAEEERKRIEEDKKRNEDQAKIHPEKRKVDAMTLSERVRYFHPIYSQKGLWSTDLNVCLNSFKQILVTYDGKYLFIYCIDIQGMNLKR